MKHDIDDFYYHQLGSQIFMQLLKGGCSPFRIVKIAHTAVPPPIFINNIWTKNGEKFGNETLRMIETAYCYTSKCFTGCIPYFLLTELCNNGNIFKCINENTDVKYDIYIPHITYMKKTGNFYFEMSIMHKNPHSRVWQTTGHPFNFITDNSN